MVNTIRLPMQLTPLLVWFSCIQQGTFAQDTSDIETYGIDVSFPIHDRVSTNYPHLDHNRYPDRFDTPPMYNEMPVQPLGNRHQMYLDHLNGCRANYKPSAEEKGFNCDEFEYDRIIMNRRQPQSMVNLTETGFKKIQSPPHLKKLIDDFWKENKDKEQIEAWASGNSYVNHWETPTTLVSVDDRGLRGSGGRLKEHIWAAASAVLEEWTQVELQPCSLYGIRVYHKGAVMLPHVDRLPLVASAIINVAQDVEEDWPTEVYDHQGNAHNVTIRPGEMLLFESHSVIHGHPFPLKGNFYASIFIHFEPTGHTIGKDESGFFYVKEEGQKKSSWSNGHKGRMDANREYASNVQQGFGGQSSSYEGGLPPYIKRESPEEEHWLLFHPEGWKTPQKILPPEAHIAAKMGQLDELEDQLKKGNREILVERDENGWQILHQAAAGGFQDVVKMLVSKGAEINARTHGGYGESPLRIAEREHGPNSPIAKYLKGQGALSIGPEL